MKLGIVGCGLIGKKRATAAMPRHTIALVADINTERAQALAAYTGAAVASDWKEIVEADLDMVIVATPHDQLAEIALAAVNHKKHVLLEKPGGRNAQEVRPIIEAAKNNNRLVKVGFNHRFHPTFQEAYRIFASGVLGEMMYIRGRYGHGGRVGYENEWRCQKDISGGGELIDQGSHLIDLARWFLGDLNVEYAALPTYYWPTHVEDNCFLALTALGGQMAWLHASWAEWKNSFSFEIYGKQGKLAIEGLGGSYGPKRLVHYQMLPEMGPPVTKVYDYPEADTSWEAEFHEFETAIKENRQPVGNIEDAVAMLDIIGNAYSKGNRA